MNLRAFLNTLGVMVVALTCGYGIYKMSNWLQIAFGIALFAIAGVCVYRKFNKTK